MNSDPESNDSYSTHICALIGGTVLLPLPLLLLLLQLLDALLQHVGPKVALKVWQLLGTSQTVLCCLFEDVLKDKEGRQTSVQFSVMLFTVLGKTGSFSTSEIAVLTTSSTSDFQ